MTIALSISKQASEIVDTSNDQFHLTSHGFADLATPGRPISLYTAHNIQGNQSLLVHTTEHDRALMTPAAQPAYARFTHRQPLGQRSYSNDGQTAETPIQTTAHGIGKTAGRWKRPGRLCLGPPKRAERQSLEPDDKLSNSPADDNINKENEEPESEDKTSPRKSIAESDESIRSTARPEDSISPPRLVGLQQRAEIPGSVLSQRSLTEQDSRVQERADRQLELPAELPLKAYHSVALCNTADVPHFCHAHETSPALESIRNIDNALAADVPRQLALSEPTPSLTSTLKAPLHAFPGHSIHLQPTELREPPSNHSLNHSSIIDENKDAHHDQAPPLKLSLEGTVCTVARKAKSLGRIVMNGREYTKLDQIGKGGSSKVYRVMAPNGKIFALKRVDFEQADRATILGYKSEIDLLNKMSASAGKERIIRLYDSEINDSKGKLLMLMEAGEIDLAHMLAKRQADPPDFNFIRLFWRHMLEAVQAVHSQKIVHSDLKPANFLLVEGSLKLIDFGIAKAIGNDTTNIHRDQQVGTVNYMSPEALSDTGTNSGRMMKLGRASDVWSLGCILYQMVYGQTPFAQLSLIQKIQAIPSGTHRIDFPDKAYAPSAAKDSVRDEITARTVDGDLLRVMRGCLERDQKARLTIEQLLNDPFLRPEDKVHRPVQSGSVSVNLNQITELLRTAVYQTREKTLRRENIQNSDIDNLAKDFVDRLRWAR